MAKTNQHGKGKEVQVSAYKTRYEANRKRRLEKALKRNPENKQIQAALQNIGYRRKTPKNRVWSSQKRQLAQLFKIFTGKFNPEIFSNNEKISGPALFTKGPYSEPIKQKPNEKRPPSEKQMFMLRNRAHDGRGNLIWSQ